LAFYYLETSALVKLYVQEPGTEHLLRLVASSETHRIAVSAIAQAEFRSAIRRRQREGDFTAHSATLVLERFDLHLRTRFIRQGVSDPVLDVACALIDRYPLRAYDAIQLAGCLVLKSAVPEAPVFVCADQQLLQTAQAEGLAWLDPTT
jgi:predicted nucleic acid-binding protein